MRGLVAFIMVSSPKGGYIDMDADTPTSVGIMLCGAGFWYRTGSSIAIGVSITLGVKDVTSDSGLWTRLAFLVKSPA